jgi:hypothetical protein
VVKVVAILCQSIPGLVDHVAGKIMKMLLLMGLTSGELEGHGALWWLMLAPASCSEGRLTF